jgi:hypothetical protein
MSVAPSRTGPMRRHSDKSAPLTLELTCVDCHRPFRIHDHEAWLALRSRLGGVPVTCGCRAIAASTDEHLLSATAELRQ